MNNTTIIFDEQHEMTQEKQYNDMINKYVKVINDSGEAYRAIRLTEGLEMSLIIPCKTRLAASCCIFVDNHMIKGEWKDGE